MSQECWFCKTNNTEETRAIPLKEAGETLSLEIPICNECQSKQKKAMIGFFSIFAIGVVATIATAVSLVMAGADINGMRTGMSVALFIIVPTAFLGLFVAKVFLKGTHLAKYGYEHPKVLEKRQEGYQ